MRQGAEVWKWISFPLELTSCMIPFKQSLRIAWGRGWWVPWLGGSSTKLSSDGNMFSLGSSSSICVLPAQAGDSCERLIYEHSGQMKVSKEVIISIKQ